MAEKKKTNTNEENTTEEIREMGALELKKGKDHIQLLTIIGEIEGHEAASANSKTTKYEHLLPKLAEVEDRAPRYQAIKEGRIPPDRCGKCAYCRATRKLEKIQHYKEISTW